jgi:hypothetical protein
MAMNTTVHPNIVILIPIVRLTIAMMVIVVIAQNFKINVATN